MGDISTWSPVDESNTMAPPDGWPEAQATNTVNNCARAMMGATRRWYDTVTAQLVGMMPRAGGAFTGPVEVPTLHATDSVTAAGNITAGGQVQAGYLYSTGNILAAGNIDVGGQVQAGYLYSTGDILAGDRIDAVAIVGNTVHANTTLSAGTSVTAPTIAASGTLSGGNISSSGTVTGTLLTSSGNLFIAGNGEINGTLAVAGTVFATGFVDTNGLFSVVDELKSLIARVHALEETAHAK